ncbi:F-box/LRR-repeat protein 20 [Podila humilis]|nr:F-box/LRR-repeat protein 20 [Podila humilis]
MYPRRRYRTVSSTVVSLDIPSMLAGVASVHIVENSHLADGPKRRDSRDSAASQLNRPLPEQGPRRVRIQSAGQLLPSSISVGASSSKLCTTPLHHDLHHRVSEDTTGLQYYRDATLPLKQQQQQQHPPVLRPHVYPSSSSPFTSSSSSSPSSSSSSCLTKTLRPSQHAQFSSPRVLSNAAAFVNSHMNNHAPSTPTTPQRAGSGSSKTSSSTETTPFHTPMHASFVKWDSPKKSNNNNKKNHNHGKSSTSMMSQALEAENTQFLQQQQGHLSNSRMLSIGFASSNSGNGSSSGSGSSSSSRSRSSSFRAQHSFYRRRGKLGFDKLPREIRVSRAWRNVALDGSLWKVIDTNRYYKTIQDDQLLHLGVSGAGFLRYVNFRGCAQLSSDSLRVLAEHCPNVERLDLTGCRQLSSKALADVCMNMTSLVHLDLAGLLSVNNYTLQAMAVYCRSLQVLNLAWCRNITGAGLSKLTKTCQQIQKLNVSGCAGLEDRWMPTMGIGLPRLKELCLNGCHSLTDRGLIGLLTGLSVGMTKKYRKKRRSLRRLSSSLRVATLGDDSLHSSSCVDDNDNGIEEEEEDDDEDKDSLDELEKEEISDNDASEIDDEDNEATASAGDNQDTGLPSSSSSSPMAQQEGLQTRLRYLGLSHCRQLTQEALRAIGHHCSRRLRRLEISGCENFGDEGLVFLAQHCTGLQRLDLEDDSLLTDASLRSFGMYLPHLERVCLSYCENITDQGVLRMLRPLTVNSNTPVNMAVNPDKFCSKLSHLELDNCVLVTDRLLLEFANVLEDRRIRNIEKQREKERKREERRERIRQKKKKAASDEVHDEEGGVGDEEEQEEAKNNVDSLRRYRHNYHGSRHSESSLRSLVEIVQNSMPSTSYVASSPTTTTTTTLVEEPTTTATTVNMSSSSSSSAATATAAAAATFISSAPVNIPTTAPYRFHPSLAAAATGAATSSSLSISSSSSPSPLQPRGVLASTSISEEMAIKKAGQRKPILRIIASTRSGTATTTLSSSSCTTSSTTPSSSSSLLPLWPSALHSRRRTMPANNDKNNKNKVRRKRFPPPTIQIFDCRNITLEGVENAQKKCESLVIKSYYSWTNPRTPTATLGTISGRGGAVRGGGLGRRSSSSGYIGGMGYNDNYYYDEGDDDDGSEDDDDDDDDEGESSLSSLNNSHNSLHQLQLQHQQQLQQQPHHRVRNLFHRARLGMMGRAGGGGHGPQCHIL